MSYLNGLPHCRWNPYVDCTHGKPKDVRIPDWIPHAKCSKCGWNPEVAMERYDQRVQKLEEEKALREYISEEFARKEKSDDIQ